MINFKSLSFVTFLVTVLIVVQSEKPCRLLIFRKGISGGGRERFVCKLAPECLRPGKRTIVGPTWQLKDKWMTGYRRNQKNTTNTLIITRIPGHDLGIYQCYTMIYDSGQSAILRLGERVGSIGSVPVGTRPRNDDPASTINTATVKLP